MNVQLELGAMIEAAKKFSFPEKVTQAYGSLQDAELKLLQTLIDQEALAEEQWSGRDPEAFFAHLASLKATTYLAIGRLYAAMAGELSTN